MQSLIGNFKTKLKEKKSEIYKKNSNKAKNVAKIMNRYNQVPHLTQDTTWESDKNTIKNRKREPLVSPLTADDKKGSNEQTRNHDKHQT